MVGSPAPVGLTRTRPPGQGTRLRALGERDFRSIKTDDLDLRPVFHRLEERVRAHA
jgi:hypothetical protein